jgi:SET domain-containing protein
MNFYIDRFTGKRLRSYKNSPRSYKNEKLDSGHPLHIFECNDKCDCNAEDCSNRLTQKPLQLNLQVFETKNCGFGVRCSHDIAKGTFIGNYAGEIITMDEMRRERNKEYFLELLPLGQCAKTAYRCVKKNKRIERIARERANKTALGLTADNLFTRLRRGRIEKPMFGERYVINAGMIGNFARFFNHSCFPNMYVQHVFDNNDLTLPRMAFFAQKKIKAGCELTFDYNLKNCSEETRTIKCRCGKRKKCRETMCTTAKPESDLEPETDVEMEPGNAN